MAGLEVRPETPPGVIRRPSSPLSTRLRRRESSHTGWPYCLKVATGLPGVVGSWFVAMIVTVLAPRIHSALMLIQAMQALHQWARAASAGSGREWVRPAIEPGA